MDSSSQTDVSNGAGDLSSEKHRVSLLYDHRMCKHFDATDHPENPNLILSIWDKLQTSGINQRCILLDAKEAEDKIIEGGQDEGMRKPCAGSVDKSRPKESRWKTFPHRLFFARDYTATWGPGGVAFLHPNSSNEDKAHLRLYRITLEQFNDVLVQETVPSFGMKNPLFDLVDLQSVEEEDDIPILTFTCTLSNVEFKSGKLPMCAPFKGYINTLIKGLTEGKLSEEEAMAYLKEACTKEL